MTAENITVVSFETDAGLTVSANCPNCGDQFIVSEYGWGNSNECSCGIKWETEFTVRGTHKLTEEN